MKKMSFVHWLFSVAIICVVICATISSFVVSAFSSDSTTDDIVALPQSTESEEENSDSSQTNENLHQGLTYSGENLDYCDSKWLLDENTNKVFDNSIEEDTYKYMPDGEIVDIHTADSVLDIYGRYVESGTNTPCTIRVCIDEDVYALESNYYYGDYLIGYVASAEDNFVDAFYGELSTKKSGDVPVRVYAINSLGEKFCVFDEELYFDEPRYENELCGKVEEMTVEGTTCHISGYAYNPEEPMQTVVIAVRISMEDMSDEKFIYFGDAAQYSYTLAQDKEYEAISQDNTNEQNRFNHQFDVTFDVEDERGYRVVSVYALYDYELESISQDYYEDNRTVIGFGNYFFSNFTYDIEEVSTASDGLPYVRGWAFDNEYLDGGFCVKFVIENEEYSALNCEYRDDVKNKYGLANNLCGFSYKAYTCTCDPGIHTLRIYITTSGGLSNYQYYALVWEGDVSIPEKREHLNAKANQIGDVDVKDNDNGTFTVSGWVQDPDNKDSQLLIAVNIGSLSDSGYIRDKFYTLAVNTKNDNKYGKVHYFNKTYSTELKGNTYFEVSVYDYQYEELGNYPSWYTPCPPNMTNVFGSHLYIRTPAAYVWKTFAGEKTKKAYYDVEEAWKAAVTSSQKSYSYITHDSNEYTIKLFCDMIGDSDNDIIHHDMRDYLDDNDLEEDEDGDKTDLNGGGGFIFLEQCSICLDLNGHTIDRRYDDDDTTIIGCCIYVDNLSNLTIKNGTIKGGHQSSRSGGGIHVNSGNLNLNNVKMCDNYTYNCGGAIYCEVSNELSSEFGHVTLNNCSLYNNYADDEGGAIYMDSGVLYVANSKILSNSADDCGGGVYMNSGKATFSNDSILYNYVNNDEGGGIYLEEDSVVRVHDCEIKNNCASLTDNDEGGGIYVEDDSTLELSGTNIIIDNYFYKDLNPFEYFFDGETGDKYPNNVCLESDDATVKSCGLDSESKIGILYEDEDDSGTAVINVLNIEASCFKADLGSCSYISTGNASEVYYQASAFGKISIGITIGCIVVAGCSVATVIYYKKRKKDSNEIK